VKKSTKLSLQGFNNRDTEEKVPVGSQPPRPVPACHVSKTS
jgi:hypothetical protein